MPATSTGVLSFRLTGEGQVRVSVEGNPEAWASTRLVIIQNARFYRQPGGEVLEVPFSEFVPLLPRLGTVRATHPELELDVDEVTKNHIRRANVAGAALEKAAGIEPVPEAELLQVLVGLGWNPARELNQNQLRNVRRLAALPHGASFSVPGAGKTTEALATFAYKTRLQARLLVVAPKNAFAAWEEQVAICLPHLHVVRLIGSSEIPQQLRSNPAVALITYSQLTYVTELIFQYLGSRPSFLILDESHKIKGGEYGAWGNAVLALSHIPVGKLILSGTPMPNEPADLLPQLRFLYPSVSPNIDPVEGIRNIYVRTTKAELDLPPVHPIGTPIPLTDAQTRLYRLCATEIARDAESTLRSRDKLALRSFGRSYLLLLQLVSNPSLLARYQGRFEDQILIECLQSESPKIAYVCYKARELAAQGHKVLIWSSFVQNVEVISERLADLGADFIHGQVDIGGEMPEDEEDYGDEESRTRELKIRRFHKDPEAKVLVANPAACSEGISLHTVCHHAIYLDRNYNAAQFLQSQDRIHRLGLPPGTETFIEYVYCPGTIDESVTRRLDLKIQRMEEALQDHSISMPTHWRANLEELPDYDDINDLLQTLRSNAV
jgi:SNF2 family DNA or RNA helicase